MKRSLIFFLILIVSISLTTTGIHSTASSPEDLPENDDTYEIYLKKDYITSVITEEYVVSNRIVAQKTASDGNEHQVYTTPAFNPDVESRRASTISCRQN
ncbi:MAG: hypothetical protein IJK33_02820 [Clostridia bacterium]|nr:hypothetical protein [Clostridia bacterium]